MTASQKRMKFVIETLSIFGDWRQDCFRTILHRYWNGCTCHLRQLIVRVRSRLSWRNLCFENNFILSLGIHFVEDETSGLLFIQHCLVSVNKSWVSTILLITHLQNDCTFPGRGVLDQILDGDVPSRFQKHTRSLYQIFQNVYPTLYQFFKNIYLTLYQFYENAYPTPYQLRKLWGLTPFLIQ